MDVSFLENQKDDVFDDDHSIPMDVDADYGDAAPQEEAPEEQQAQPQQDVGDEFSSPMEVDEEAIAVGNENFPIGTPEIPETGNASDDEDGGGDHSNEEVANDKESEEKATTSLEDDNVSLHYFEEKSAAGGVDESIVYTVQRVMEKQLEVLHKMLDWASSRRTGTLCRNSGQN